ncbi:glycine cleavage system protein R [Nocardioides acrostichi]|uniref:Amino acid-binding protein n=1 Tax=Nocardioides acrostichi TaxID=2784339 RepID=A0A930UXW4_9ACTN|nr:ACT domain-containing protein [Nocardioides acrostichi]MBF4162898.1 amino acid-binding protein [Nocardioides acrostichi]
MTDPTTLHAVTVLGHDRPGIIADTTARLADLGLNLEDSTMTLLRGQFAMMLLCAGGDATLTQGEIEAALAPLTVDGTLDVTVREVRSPGPGAGAGSPWLLTVHGGDRPGIVSSLVSRIAEVGGNITDLTTRLAGGLYLLIAEIDLPAQADADALVAVVGETAASLDVTATLRPTDPDEL